MTKQHAHRANTSAVEPTGLTPRLTAQFVLHFNAMPFKYRTSAPPASREAIELLESMIEKRLPDDYRQMLSKQNGGSLDLGSRLFYGVPPEFPGDAIELEGFLPVEDVVDEYRRLREDFDINLLPVGLDDSGNYVCLGIDDLRYSAIYFVDHELVDEETGKNLVVRVADSLSSFVHQLSVELD